MIEAVAVGQVWAHPEYSHRWKIAEISDRGVVFAHCGTKQSDGTVRWSIHLDRLGGTDCFANSNSDWFVESRPSKTHSKINQKTLRKRMRDQEVQKILTGKL